MPSRLIKITNISHRSSKVIYGKLRLDITKFFVHDKPEKGEFECDECYFGPRHIRGKRGRGTVGKTPTFSVLRPGGKVYRSILSDSSAPLIQRPTAKRVAACP